MAGSTTVNTSLNASGLLEFAKNLNAVTSSINNSVKLIGTLGKAFDTLSTMQKSSELAMKAYNLSLQASKINVTQLAATEGIGAAAKGLLTKVQLQLNAAIAANPVAAFITILVAATAIIATLSTVMNHETEEAKKQREEREKLCEETQKLCEANKEVTDSISSGRTERQRNLENIEAEALVAEKLTDELYKLAEKENKSAAEKAKMKSIVDKLNEILPDLNLHYDEENGLLNLNREKVEEVIAAKERLAKQNAAAEMMQNAYMGQLQAASHLNKLLQQEAELREKMKGYKGSDWDEANKSLQELQGNIETARQAYLDSSQEYKRAQGIFASSMNETAQASAINAEQIKRNFRSFAQEAPESIAGVKDAVYQFGNVLIAQSEVYGTDFVDAWFGAVENAGDDAYQSLDIFMDYVLQSMDRDDDMKDSGAGGGKNYAGGVQEGIDGSEIDTSGLAEDATEGFKYSGGEAGKSWVKLFWEDLTSAIHETNENIGIIFRWMVSECEAKLEECGKYITDVLIKGIVDGFSSLKEKVTTEWNNAWNTLVEQIIPSITASASRFADSIVEMIRTAVTGLQEKLAEFGRYITEDLIGGIVQGFQSIPGNLTSAISGFKDKLVEKFKNFFGIHSPSRVFAKEIGKPISQGIAVGIASEKEAVRSAAAEVVDAAIDEANRRISRDENGNMLVEGLQVGITVGEDFGKDAMDAAVKNLKLQLDTAAITTADYYRELEKLRNNYLTRGSEEWWKYTKEVMEYEQKRVEEAKKANKEAFEEELHLLERKQKLGLISEQEYYIGMKYLRDSYFTEGEEEWQDYTEKIEDFAVKQTQTLTDQVGKLLQGLYDEADKALQDVLSSMDSFRDSVSDFGNYMFRFSVKNQNGRIIDQSTGLVDFGFRQKQLERFTELFKQIKELPNIPKKILEDIKKMKPEDAVGLMELMLRTPQQALQDWFEAEQDFMNTVDQAADALYGDDLVAAEENIRKVDELKQSVLDMCNELGISVPDSFAAMGTASKDNFFAMFKEVAGEIEGLMEQLQFTVSLNQSALTVNVEPYSGTAVTAASSSQTYAPTYYFAASGDSTARQIQAANANDTINRLRGVSF